jgi:hypothetical protein
MRFEVLTAVTVAIIVFWDVTPCRLIRTNISDEQAASIFTSTLNMEGVGSSETLIPIYEITRSLITEKFPLVFKIMSAFICVRGRMIFEQILKKDVGLERGPLSLVRIIEELLE